MSNSAAGINITTNLQVRKHFTVDDYSHYVFTPRDLTQWVLGMMRYPLAQDSSSFTAGT